MTSPLPASTIKQTIIYLNLLSFVPPERMGELPSPRESFGEDWTRAVEAASRLIVAFQQASRDPGSELVAELARAALGADSSPGACRAFQDQMQAISELPGRAKFDNRRHRKKGCRFCEVPCRYGYFSLISEPDFKSLQRALETENSKSPQDQQPLQAIWKYTLNHLSQTLDAGQWNIPADHLGNLSYCLAALATAKSRYLFPEAQMRKFQDLNQQMIRQYQQSRE